MLLIIYYATTSSSTQTDWTALLMKRSYDIQRSLYIFDDIHCRYVTKVLKEKHIDAYLS